MITTRKWLHKICALNLTEPERVCLFYISGYYAEKQGLDLADLALKLKSFTFDLVESVVSLQRKGLVTLGKDNCYAPVAVNILAVKLDCDALAASPARQNGQSAPLAALRKFESAYRAVERRKMPKERGNLQKIYALVRKTGSQHVMATMKDYFRHVINTQNTPTYSISDFTTYALKAYKKTGFHCDTCSRTRPHIHCAGCGSITHEASGCPMLD